MQYVLYVFMFLYALYSGTGNERARMNSGTGKARVCAGRLVQSMAESGESK